MLGAIGGLLSGLVSGVLAPLFSYLNKTQDVTLEGFKTAAGLDTEAYKAALAAQTEMAQLRAAQNTWWGARLIILLAGGSASLHFAAVMLDSTFRFGWGVAKVPPPYDGYEWAIVQSFFLLAPAMPLVSAASTWLGRR